MSDTPTRPGELVQTHLGALLARVETQDPSELDRLLDAGYSRVTFGLVYPFGRRVDDLTEAEHRRYWVGVHRVLGVDVRVTNHWYDEHVPDLVAYLAAIGVVPADLTADEQRWARPPALPVPAPPTPGIDLAQRAVSEFLALQAGAIHELRRRGIVRGAGSPLGEVAELVVHRALPGSVLADPAMKAYDVTDEKWGRVQVKARTVSNPPRPSQLQSGIFRSEGFDHAALVLLDETTYDVVRAVLLPLAAVQERWGHRPRVNGWALQMNGPTMNHPAAIDITEAVQKASRSLD
ncbi:hypothetical protein INN71_08735 [Nocardioides sp. ChNu-153]|uniref:hypothetical protein n=1 Tax=Nocardioides sp. ChNu-153 TaxID=2779364 RepID=UPI00264DC475|nr:hypothetical protein [Nocardioides sp. ChNu-153]MDN7121474.1 hypothetical protein [Nocardioides sp. ChNu-153]